MSGTTFFLLLVVVFVCIAAHDADKYR